LNPKFGQISRYGRASVVVVVGSGNRVESDFRNACSPDTCNYRHGSHFAS
jgi:hypothetical protein